MDGHDGENAGKCPVAHGARKPANRDWWPNQLDLGILHQQSNLSDPMGEKFDSNLHQAMFEVPGTDKPAGTIVQVLQAGYVLHDRLLRPAMVGVAKAQPAPSGPAAEEGHIDTIA